MKHAADLAADESWWNYIANSYPPSPDPVINLEHGYFGAMAAPVQQAFDDGIRLVNGRLSPFVRGEFTHKHLDELRSRLAALINAKQEEILITRSASESMQVLIGQYHGLAHGDAVLCCNLDYPAMRSAMHSLQGRRGVTVIELQFELPISSDALLERYQAAIRDTPNLKLMLLSHVYPCNGQVAPVKEIIAAARSHGIDALVDSAHALGQIPLDVQEQGFDFAGFNLHKWIGAPLGIGFSFIRKTRLDRVEPHLGNREYPIDDIRGRLYMGAPPIYAALAVPAALDFHKKMGGSRVKAARFSRLRTYWMSRVAHLPSLQLMSPIEAEHGSALGAFTLEGMDAQNLQQVLLERFGIFTVVRNIGYTNIVRATVAITTTIDDLDRFVDALTTLCSMRSINQAGK